MVAPLGPESSPINKAGYDEWVRRVLGFDPAGAASAYVGTGPPNVFGTPPPSARPGQGQHAPAVAQMPPPTPERVRSIQDGLSKWRMAAGGTALPASGKLDQDTKQAILDFQRQAGLHPQDGAYGPALEKRLAAMLKLLD